MSRNSRILHRLLQFDPSRKRRQDRFAQLPSPPPLAGLGCEADQGRGEAPPSRRALLRRGGASAVLIALATLGRRAFAAGSVVAIDNFTFSPTPITVAPGTELTWENHDDIPHAIYVPDLNLHSHALDTNETFSHRFDQAGTFDYICSIHPHMRGRIVVSG